MSARKEAKRATRLDPGLAEVVTLYEDADRAAAVVAGVAVSMWEAEAPAILHAAARIAAREAWS